jgi:large subunit ribosomal protein L13
MGLNLSQNGNKVDTLSYKTISVKPSAQMKNWVVVDAESAVLGRLASQVAKMIRGKHKPGFTPHIDCGDHVIVINCDKIKLTGSKWDDKEYLSHTGYPGGQRVTTPRRLAAKNPASIIERAVKGMLPKNRIGRSLFGSLHVYAGPTHPHMAQNPTQVTLIS